ncbi:MAG: zinc transporter ZntB [Oleiphilaceae bacterium]|nr:zinc transporter ZntB [Oleiphilaceae bacterium]
MSDALIYGFQLTGTEAGTALDWQRVQSNALPADELCWLHFDYTHPDTATWLATQELNDIVVNTLLSEETRPRTSVFDDGVLLTLRGINLNPESDPEDMVSIRIWASEKRIVTARHRRMLSAQDMVHRIEQGQSPQSAGEFVSVFAERLIARMQTVITSMEDKVEEIEEKALEQNAKSLRSDIADLRRQAVALRRYLKPQQEAMQRLQQTAIAILNDEHRAQLRETTNHLTRYIEELEAIRDRAAITQEELASVVAEQLNNRMYVLSIVAALFLPLGFFTGLLGINVGGLPGADNDSAFLLFCLIMVALVAAQIVIFRVKRWF